MTGLLARARAALLALHARAALYRNERRHLKATGRCVSCGRNPVIPGQDECAECWAQLQW